MGPLLERLGTIGRAYEHALPSLRYGEVDRALVAGILLIAANVAIAALVRRRYAGVRDQHEASTLETI